MGLGGRLDATNVIHPELAVITRIGLDHTDILGGTLREIAREKAGIIKTGIPVVCGLQEPAALDELRRAARVQGAAFHAIADDTCLEAVSVQASGCRFDLDTPLQTYSGLAIDLAGMHQVENAALAVRSTELLFPGEAGIAAQIAQALRNVRSLSGLRGRLEVYRQEPLVVLDVGHNSEGLDAALAFMTSQLAPRQGQLYVAFGTMRDKDVSTMARQLANARAMVMTIPLDTERAFSPEEAARRLETEGVRVEPVRSASDVLARFYERSGPADGLLITGSHFTAAQFDAMAG